MREHMESGAGCWCDPTVIPAGFVGESHGVTFDGTTVAAIIVHNDIEEV